MSLRDWTILRNLDSNLLKQVRLAFVFGVSGSEAFVVTRENEVFAVGRNVSGCLGFDTGKNSHYAPRNNAEQNFSLSRLDIKSFAAACSDSKSSSESISVVVVTQDGEVYNCGPYSCKTDGDNVQYAPFYAVVISDKVKEVACGTKHFLALTEIGKVYSWGNNDLGQLGYAKSQYSGDGKILNREVTGLIQGKNVVEIGCGSYFSLALIDDGTVFGWGCYKYGQLGFRDSRSYSRAEVMKESPVLVPLSSALKIRRIACGPEYVLALNRNGDVYGWGKSFSSDGPSKISLMHRVTDIAASYLHELSVAETETGKIIFWGQSSTGQIFKPTVSNFESIDEAFAYLARSMHKPLVIPECERMTVAESLEKELGNKETADLVIQTGSNEQIHVHKAILKMRSKYFKAKLPQLLEKNDKIVKVETKSFPAMKAYLEYVYTDKLQVNLDLATELFKMAEKFNDVDFKKLCERNIKRQMKPEKVAEIYSATRKLPGAEDLNKYCLEYAVKHACEVMDSPGYKNWDLETLQTFIPEYVKSRGC